MPSSIVNYYERLVFERIRETLRQADEAADVEHIEDIACVALNHLPPRYVRHSVDLASHLTDEEHYAMEREVTDAVTLALTTTQGRRQSREAGEE